MSLEHRAKRNRKSPRSTRFAWLTRFTQLIVLELGKLSKPSKLSVLCLLLFALCTLLFALKLEAKVTGACSNCHTMHNSQGGQPMAYQDDRSTLASTPYKALVIYSCVGCHSATNATTWKDSVTNAPIVFNTSEPTYNTAKGLAAGNFYWVTTEDAKGHNVFASNPESTLTRAPGKPTGGGSGCSGTDSCHMNIHGSTLPPAFGFDSVRQGCTKCHMVGSNFPMGYHHKDDSGPLKDSAAEGWYRFLDGHQSGAGQGVSGLDDDDWEQETSTDHNEYLGNSASKTSDGGFSTCGNTMTGFCTGCHVKFHVEDDAAAGMSPWLRHPSDTILPNSGEYSAYTVYNPLVPVARPDLVSGSWSASSNTIRPGQDLVMCLSCHRAHGSPYFKILRWDYKGWPASGSTNGCNVCHASKN